MNPKIKVEVVKLLSAIEDRKAEVLAEYEAAVAAHPAKLAEWEKDALAAIDVALGEIHVGKRPGICSSSYSSSSSIPHPPPPPARPDTAALDRSIATLRMAAEPTIAITAEDYARYIS